MKVYGRIMSRMVTEDLLVTPEIGMKGIGWTTKKTALVSFERKTGQLTKEII